MDGFGTIRLHDRTIKRFKGFSRKFKSSYSETLEAVMDFFEWHGIQPSNRYAEQINKEEQKTRKRVEATIAIIRNIEKTQTLPTNIMLEALFGKHEIVRKRKEPKLVETKFEKLTREEWNKKENKVSRIKYDQLKEKNDSNMEIILNTLNKVQKIEPRFGKPYLKIEISPMELAKLKRQFTN
ncbi:hypothetical protein FEE95_13920 [Maribacter algarum]|uniref:Uncharacterized protein n=1 Tax=Maribacter algarum (ex Zhang et al. 2020) TaxID=2578118 RepID=A0A5S3PMQ8_9FLAO|nr:BfmA/BtgA family mobilization protein [Maribacter algarum]TMM55754.1 hypothetical protein FEE95_13920 [Maribacter algarum]